LTAAPARLAGTIIIALITTGTSMYNRIRLLALFTLVSLAFTAPASVAQPAPESPRYFRSQESQDGEVLTMQLATRTFKREADHRTLSLAAMVHIADRSFYKAMQQRLDVLDLVLFEGVRPPGGGRAEFDLDAGSDEAKSNTTKRRIRFLAVAINLHKSKHGTLPNNLDELTTKASERLSDLVKANLVDAWDRPLQYMLLPELPAANVPATKHTFELTSLGSDGAPGGDAAAADLLLTQQEPLKASEIPKAGESQGLQQQMASALGLVFQLDEMDHTKPNWRSSDLSVDQIEDRMSKGGANADELFKMLDGSGFQANLAKMVLGLIKFFPSAQVYGKIALMEMMSHADDLLAIAPGSLAGAMEVIIKDRNAVVIADLKQALETEPKLNTIGIIYGGGHMAELEKSISDLGFKETGVQWTDAITLDLKAAGFSSKDVKQIRGTITSAIDQQIKAAKRQAKKKTKAH